MDVLKYEKLETEQNKRLESYSVEEIEDLIKDFLQEAKKNTGKASIISDALESIGHNVGPLRDTISGAEKIIEDAWTRSWQGAAVGGASGFSVGVIAGSAIGGIPGAVVGGIVGLIVGGVIGGAFARDFCKLVDRLKQVELSVGNVKVRAHLA